MINPFLKTPRGQHGKHIEIKNLRKSWSKYGGIKLGLEKIEENWFCQICRQEQPKQIEPFLFPMTDREFLRICPSCEYKKLQSGVITYEAMIIMCRGLLKREIFSEF
jgi:hypothetical protein